MNAPKREPWGPFDHGDEWESYYKMRQRRAFIELLCWSGLIAIVCLGLRLIVP